MRFRTYPNTDLTVSEIGFGLWTLSTGWWGEYTDEQGVELLKKAKDLGVTLFDTADTYGNGRGETLLQKAFPGEERKEIVIATKFGYDFYNTTPEERKGQRELPQNFSSDFVRFALEESLKRLGTDYIDLYQIHNSKWDSLKNDELFALLEKLKQEGKIRHFGIALGPAIGWREEGIFGIRERNASSVQIIYNMLEQDPGRDFFEAARETDAGFLVRVPHSSGLLEGKYNENTTFGPNDHRNHRKKEWLIDGLKKLEKLKFLTEDTGRTIGQAALRFVLAEPRVMSALPNIYNEEQLREFAEASDCPDLTPLEMEQIAELYANRFGLEPAAS